MAFLSIGAQALTTIPAPLPKPDAEGAYFVGPHVTAPGFVKLMTAGYPSGVQAKHVAGMTVLSLIVGTDGVAKNVAVVQSHGEDFDASAINAVQKSQFAPGGLDGKAVPVRIDVRVVFHADGSQAVPVVLIAERDLPLPAVKAGPNYTPPIPIHTADADFTEPRPTKSGKPAYSTLVAIVTVEVNAQGELTDVRIRRGLAFGMDAKAIAAVKRYRFLPATNKGRPVAASREIEVRFNP